jgi:hypothetical protein
MFLRNIHKHLPDYNLITEKTTVQLELGTGREGGKGERDRKTSMMKGRKKGDKEEGTIELD